jgi:hypothetical protein
MRYFYFPFSLRFFFFKKTKKSRFLEKYFVGIKKNVLKNKKQVFQIKTTTNQKNHYVSFRKFISSRK